MLRVDISQGFRSDAMGAARVMRGRDNMRVVESMADGGWFCFVKKARGFDVEVCFMVEIMSKW